MLACLPIAGDWEILSGASTAVIEEGNGVSRWADEDCASAESCAIAIDIVTSKTRVIDPILSFTSATVGIETKTYAYYLASAVCPHAPSVLTLLCTFCIFSVLHGISSFISSFSRRTGILLEADSLEC